MNQNPTTFISYAWESDELKLWVKNLAKKLRNNGIDVKLDQWELLPGDQITHFMEKSVRDNDYVLIICTPKYKTKSEERIGGVGYEGDIMTAEVVKTANHRKFIPILKSGTKITAIPTWIEGKYFIDLSDENHFSANFEDLTTTLLNTREAAPKLGNIPHQKIADSIKPPITPLQNDEIKIKGIIVDEVSQPLNDGTPGSALYRIPFELNTNPSSEWINLFMQEWNFPTRFSSMHRPSIASVYRNTIILNGTTIEEVEKYHKDTLKLAVENANQKLKEKNEDKIRQEELELQRLKAHQRKLEDISKRISFDD